jgi:hypothetical protein
MPSRISSCVLSGTNDRRKHQGTDEYTTEHFEVTRIELCGVVAWYGVWFFEKASGGAKECKGRTLCIIGFVRDCGGYEKRVEARILSHESGDYGRERG